MAYGLPSEGTRRLQLGIGGLAVALCFLSYVVIIVLHGPPYWAGWWVAMLLVLVAVFFSGRVVAPLLEWIIAGYRV
jgi:hypothetical protein